MRRLSCSLAVLLACFFSIAQAQTRISVNQFLDGLLSMSASKCQNRDDALARQYESQGRIAEAHSIRSAEKMLCECMPARVKRLRSNLPPADRNRPVSEVEFTTRYMPDIVNACAGSQLRSTYGDGCADRFNGRVSNAATYCSCMSSKLREISDAEAAEIGSASADYLPLAAAAQKQGLSAPTKPPALERFGVIEMNCRKN